MMRYLQGARPGLRWAFPALLGAVLCLPLLPGSLHAQAHRDPLTAEEEEQVRESTELPSGRIKVYAQFIALRVSALQQLGKTPDAKGHPHKIHDLLEDYSNLCDELAANFDEYQGYETNNRFPVPDLRKQLTKMQPQFDQWLAVLKALPPNDGYDFARDTAIDAHAQLVDAYKDLVAHQTVWFQHVHERDEEKMHKVDNPDVR